MIDHLDQPPLAEREQLGDHTEELLGHVDRHGLHRLVQLAADHPGDDLRLADGELEALSTQHLDEHGELQLTATLHLPGIGSLRGQQANRDVADKLGVEAVLEQPGGDLGPFGPR